MSLFTAMSSYCCLYTLLCIHEDVAIHDVAMSLVGWSLVGWMVTRMYCDMFVFRALNNTNC